MPQTEHVVYVKSFGTDSVDCGFLLTYRKTDGKSVLVYMRRKKDQRWGPLFESKAKDTLERLYKTPRQAVRFVEVVHA